MPRSPRPRDAGRPVGAAAAAASRARRRRHRERLRGCCQIALGLDAPACACASCTWVCHTSVALSSPAVWRRCAEASSSATSCSCCRDHRRECFLCAQDIDIGRRRRAATCPARTPADEHGRRRYCCGAGHGSVHAAGGPDGTLAAMAPTGPAVALALSGVGRAVQIGGGSAVVRRQAACACTVSRLAPGPAARFRRSCAKLLEQTPAGDWCRRRWSEASAMVIARTGESCEARSARWRE